ncbi:MAG: hypothetical protein FJZ97_14740 [Chloroflexi bacterium]|nr:hypothetical protein [Chloroflexota bacterium]
MQTQTTTLAFRPTPIDELRRPHPEQKRIDADSAALLRATALEAFRHMAAGKPPAAQRAAQTRIG